LVRRLVNRRLPGLPAVATYRGAVDETPGGAAGSAAGAQPAAGRGLPRPHRPAPYADLTELIDTMSTSEPVSRAEIASATAAVVVEAGRAQADPSADFVALADRVGIDTLAELWRDAEPVSLPGALWALYLLRQWCRSNGDEVALLWRAGEHLAAPDAVVAGVADFADVAAVHRVADSVLSGAYRGDFAVALERAAALFRVLAAGRRERAADGPDGQAERERADRNDRAAAGLTASAARWREGTLR
jgi:hypothetical protein